MSGGVIRFLGDEDFDRDIIRGLLRRRPAVDMLTAAQAGTLGLPDLQVLARAAEHVQILLTHDENTMIAEFDEYVAAGNHSPGLIIVHQNAPIGPTIDDLVLIWEASDLEEWRDRREFLPL